MLRKLSGIMAALLAMMMVLTSCGDRDVDSSSSEESTVSAKKDEAAYNAIVTAEDFHDVKGVAMGGGGYVTGIVIHPADPNIVYIRTDVGGAYRWEASTKSWTPLNEAMLNSSYFGVDGMAVDPNNKDVVYMCAGNGYPSDVFKSTDRGSTWTATKLLKQFKGNQSRKESGECIQVDPNNSNVVVVGTRDAGIYYSTDAAGTWKKANVNIEGTFEVRSVVIDRTSARGGRSMVMYAVVSKKGVVKSTDGGENWSLMTGSPEGAYNVNIANNGKVYLTAGKDGVYSLVGNNFVAITPDTNVTSGYNSFVALAVDPTNSNRIAVSVNATKADGTYSPMQLPILYSADGGTTWTNVSGGKRNKAAPWWPSYHFSSATADLAFTGTNSLWFTDWYGIWRTDNLADADARVWDNYEQGHEEMVTFGAITTPTDKMIVMFAQADNGVIRYTESLTEYPAQENKSGNGQFFDYYIKNPNFIACAGGTSNSGTAGAVMYTDDAGLTWTSCEGWDSKNVAHNVAICSESSSIMVAVGVNNVPYYTYNKGRTWTKSQGAPNDAVTDYWSRSEVIASDPVKGNVFYLLTHKGFYVSEDWGANWTCTDEDVKLPAAVGGGTVLTYEGHSGEIWVETAGRGVFYSKDYGKTFAEIEGLSKGVIALGKGKEEGTLAFWYMGTIGTNREAVYYSLDNGETFTKVTDFNKYTLVKSVGIYGDMNKFGRVYIGSSGRGWYYIDITEADE